MQKQTSPNTDLIDFGIMFRISAAGILGAIIALLLVQIGLEMGSIAPDDIFRMNDAVGIPAMTTSMVAATLALYYRKPSRV